jgi:hypothetical protein
MAAHSLKVTISLAAGSMFYVVTMRLLKHHLRRYLAKKQIPMLEHPPYCPDLAPRILLMFPKQSLVDDSSERTLTNICSSIYMQSKDAGMHVL